jgi:hypothetical protein
VHNAVGILEKLAVDSLEAVFSDAVDVLLTLLVTTLSREPRTSPPPRSLR